MARLGIVLRRGKAGAGTLLYVLRHQDKQLQVSTGLSVQAHDWDARTQCVVGGRNAAQLNQMLAQQLADLRLRLSNIAMTNDLTSMSIQELRARLWPALAETRQRPADTLGTLMRDYADGQAKRTTRAAYNGTLNKLAKYCDVDELRLTDITYDWLAKFDAWMRTMGNSTNTRSIHLRNVRTIYNEAIRRGIITQEGYPFRAYRIRHEDTAKRSLSVDQLRLLRDYPCEPNVRKYVDVFFISLYLAGINMVDLLQLPPIRGNTITYRRSKTGVICTITVPPEARVLIDRYRGRTHMLEFGERYADRHDFVRRLNENLQRVGEVYHTHMTTKTGARHAIKHHRSLFPGLTSYWARHSWATLAADLDVPDAVIDAALGHKSPYPMTDIYVRRNARKVDEAIRRVIDYLNEV